MLASTTVSDRSATVIVVDGVLKDEIIRSMEYTLSGSYSAPTGRFGDMMLEPEDWELMPELDGFPWMVWSSHVSGVVTGYGATHAAMVEDTTQLDTDYAKWDKQIRLLQFCGLKRGKRVA